MNKIEKGPKKGILGDPAEKELESIKRLLVLLLMKAGATQDEVGAALEKDRSRVSRMFEGIKIKKFGEEKQDSRT